MNLGVRISFSMVLLLLLFQIEAKAQFCGNNQSIWKSPRQLRISIHRHWQKSLNNEFKEKVGSHESVRFTYKAKVAKNGDLSNLTLVNGPSSKKLRKMAVETIKRHSSFPDVIADEYLENGVTIVLDNQTEKKLSAHSVRRFLPGIYPNSKTSLPPEIIKQDLHLIPYLSQPRRRKLPLGIDILRLKKDGFGSLMPSTRGYSSGQMYND